MEENNVNEFQSIREIEQEIDRIKKLVIPYNSELTFLKKKLLEQKALDFKNAEGKFFKQDIDKMSILDISEDKGIKYFYIKKYDKLTRFLTVLVFNLHSNVLYCEEQLLFLFDNSLVDLIEIDKKEYLEARKEFLKTINTLTEPI